MEETDPAALPFQKQPPFPWLPVLAFILTALVLVFSLLWYRKHQDNTGPERLWNQIGDTSYLFKVHPATDAYYKTKEEFVEGSNPKVLKDALFKRALHNVPLVLHVQGQAHGAHTLYKRSMIQEQAWRNFKQSEEMVRIEIEEVKYEADLIEPGWSDHIWGQAVQLHRQLQERHRQLQMQQRQVQTQQAQGQQGPQGQPAAGAGQLTAGPQPGQPQPPGQQRQPGPPGQPGQQRQARQPGQQQGPALTPQQLQQLQFMRQQQQMQQQQQAAAAAARLSAGGQAATAAAGNAAAAALAKSSTGTEADKKQSQAKAKRDRQKEKQKERKAEDAAKRAAEAAERAAQELLAMEAREPSSGSGGGSGKAANGHGGGGSRKGKAKAH